MTRTGDPRLAALRTAFPYTVPILAGFLFLGLAYGISIRTSLASRFGTQWR